MKKQLCVLATVCIALVSGAHADTKQKIGQWHVTLGTDRIHELPTFDAFNRDDESGTALAIACSAGKRPDVGIGRTDFTPNDTLPLEYRFDKKPPVSASFEELRGFIYLKDGDVAQFVRLLPGSAQLSVRATGLDGGRLEATFSLEGGAEISQLLKKTCG